MHCVSIYMQKALGLSGYRLESQNSHHIITEMLRGPVCEQQLNLRELLHSVVDKCSKSSEMSEGASIVPAL